MYLATKRPFMLLEVMIAFAIIVLCIFPIIAPNVAIVKAQRDFGYAVELDHITNLLYGDMVERLYLNEIPWNLIEDQKWIPIESEDLKRIGYEKAIPFDGKYVFTILSAKPPAPAPRRLYEISLKYEFTPSPSLSKAFTTPQIHYEYVLFIDRQTKEGANP